MKTTFLFTVDVESRSEGDPECDILGSLPGHAERYGIEKIMDILESVQARGTFFLNAYEMAKHGENLLANAARLIHSRGHDLELHTHPLPMYRFYGMSKAPLEDQVAILKKGISLLEQWTGKQVIAHRAGAFAANAATLHACEQARLLADCSLSPGSRIAAPLVGDLGASNVTRRIGKLWEIPVTYYCPMRLGRWHSKRILDIESSSLAEIKKITRWACRNKLPTVCILMHSFSLSRHGRPNRRIIRQLSALLAWLQQQEGIELATVEQVCRRLAPNMTFPGILPTPTTGFWLTWRRALVSWNDGWKNRFAAMTSIVGLIVLVFVVVYLGHALWGR